MGFFKKARRQSWDRFLASRDPQTACNWISRKLRSKGRDVSFGFDESQNLYWVKDRSGTAYFGARMRGFHHYYGGIAQRGAELAKTYFLDRVPFQQGDVVIDCGANYADLYQWFRGSAIDVRYISFEPSPREFACIEKNVPDGENHNMALSNTVGSFDFYVSSEGGNSSLILPKDDYTDIAKVETTTLDAFFEAHSLNHVKLLKLEAEGAEPEILEGGQKSLESIEFIAVDGGEERGVREESTIESIANHLISSNFELLKMDIRTGSGRGLFRNKKFAL